MTEFRPGQPADQAHRALKSALQTMEKAKQCAVLWFGDFLQLCRKLEKLPKVKEQVATGKLGYTAAVVPVRVNLEMSPSQFARYEELWEQIRKQGAVPAEKVEALLAVMAGFAAGSSPRGELSPPVYSWRPRA